MKKIWLLCLCFFAVKGTFAQSFTDSSQIEFFEGHFRALLSKAQEDDKLILIVNNFSLLKKGLSQKELQTLTAILQKKIICYEIPFINGEGKSLARIYKLSPFGYATYQILNKQGAYILPKSNEIFLPSEILKSFQNNLINDIKYGLKNPSKFVQMKKTLEQELPDFELSKQYLLQYEHLYKKGRNDKITIEQILSYKNYFGEKDCLLCKEYLTKLREKDFENAEVINILTENLCNVSYQEIETYLSPFFKNMPNKLFLKIINEYYQNIINNKFENALVNYADYILLSRDINDDSLANTIRTYIKIKYYRDTKDSLHFMDSAKVYADKLLLYAKKDLKNIVPNLDYGQIAHELNNISWWVYEMYNDRKSLKEASKWAETSISVMPSYYNLDTYGKILYKLGDKEKAIIEMNKLLRLTESDWIENNEISVRETIGQMKSGTFKSKMIYE